MSPESGNAQPDDRRNGTRRTLLEGAVWIGRREDDGWVADGKETELNLQEIVRAAMR